MLEIDHLTIKYGKRTILENQSLKLQHGHIIGIRGVSGAGKTSILNVIGLLKTPNKDCSYRYNGVNVNLQQEQSKSKFRFNHIGFIFQQENLLNNLTAAQNIMLPLMMCEKDHNIINKEAQKWMKYVKVDHVQNNYPEDLSGGEEQRVAIARTLAMGGDIILADEPTASLDNENKEIVMEILEKLAHELGKIVVIVSHDDEVVSYCDEIYDISGQKLVFMKNKEIAGVVKEQSVHEKKKLLAIFIRNYEKLRRHEKNVNIFMIVITAIIVAITSLSFSFGEGFTKQQKNFVNSISNRNLLVINDTLGLNAQGDYESAESFEDKIITDIEKIPNVEKSYPYYEFTSNGGGDNQGKNAKIVITDNGKNIADKSYEALSEDGFRVEPLFPEENVSGYLQYQSEQETKPNDMFVTEALASELTAHPEDLIDKEVKITCFVPTKDYISEAVKPVSNDRIDNENSEETIAINLHTYKLVIITGRITGVLNHSYSNGKSNSDNGKNFIMKSEDLYQIIEANREEPDSTVSEFKEKKLNPRTLVVYAESYEDVMQIQDKIEKLSPTISVINKVGDIEKTQENLSTIRYTMIFISVVIMVIIALLFGLLYYFKNRERKKEIGVLKALGLNSSDVLELMSANMIKLTGITFLLSIFISVILEILVNGVFQNRFITVSVFSITLSFIISVVVVVLSGMLSVLKTSKIDVVDAIRFNK